MYNAYYKLYSCVVAGAAIAFLCLIQGNRNDSELGQSIFGLYVTEKSKDQECLQLGFAYLPSVK